jgi:branched-chain amino acid aminotransferase
MIWLNGNMLRPEDARIDPRDRGFTLGDGLFETLAAMDGRPLALGDHLERLARGSAVLGLPLPVEASEVAMAINALLAANDLAHGPAALRLTLSRGVGSRGLLVPLDPKPVLVITAGAHPPVPHSLDAAVVPIRRNEGSPLSRIKSLNYLDNVLAQQQASAQGAEEGLMLNNRGDVAGFARGNVFTLSGKTLLTPLLADGALDGLTRARLLRRAAEAGLNAAETTIGIESLAAPEGIFITNSLLGCVPIGRLDGVEIPQDAGLAAKLAALAQPEGA